EASVPPISQEYVENLASNFVGTRVPLLVSQTFQYVTGEIFLPLFPEMHGEKLALTGKHGGAAYSIDLHFDLHTVYRVAPLALWSDASKVMLATRVAGFLEQYEYFKEPDFYQLFLNLAPTNDSAAKKVYGDLI